MKRVNQLKSMTWKQSSIFAVLSLACLLAGCGGGSGDEVPKPPAPAPVSVAVSVSPSSATLNQAATRQFSATVTGSANTAVTWSVQEPAGGSVASGGLYTAPATVGTFHVIATSQADPTKSAIAIATIVSVSVAVSISPSSVTMAQGATWLFTQTVTGSANMAVNWSVQEPAGGSVTSWGFYTSPNTAGTFHVVATSQADPTKAAIAIATVVPTSVGRFISAGSMATARVYHTATRLPDGRVLVAGGGGGGGVLSSAELFDPANGTFSPTGAMNQRRSLHTATLLGDGTVLIVGGDGGNGLTTAEVYNPATGSFSMTGNLLVARSDHTATKLANGTVLIAGGYSGDDFQPALDTAEIYDPATRAFASAGQMRVPRVGHSASLLHNGKVLLAGGYTNTNNGQATFSAELYDPSTGMFFVTRNMSSPRMGFVAAVLLDGKVLVAGGHDDARPIATAEVYDPGIGSFFPVGAMNAARAWFAGVTLQDGTVLLSGGSGFSASAELFRPGTGTFEAIGGMTWDRVTGHTATLLADGRVLVIGGWNSDGNILASAELYTP
jgi:hypothetical protein